LSEAHPAPAVFERIVCAFEDTEESLEAIRQAVRLRAPGGRLHVFGAVYLAGAIAAGWSEDRITAELDQEVGEAFRRAVGLADGGATSRLINGPLSSSVLAELARERATLVAVGAHSHHRLLGALLGYLSTTLLHEAECSVLAARASSSGELFPRSIVAGVDGSPEAAAAYAVATELADRFGSTLRPIAAYGGKYVDVDTLSAEFSELGLDMREPVEALIAAAQSSSADLIVVGNRGLHGLRALGSVSERVAHRAGCSVLVVRNAAGVVRSEEPATGAD
jgi:nucleotide-binding universal stress UspA family protein